MSGYAGRFAQDDDFLAGLKASGYVCRKHEKIEKSQALGMTEGRAALSFGSVATQRNSRSLHFASLRSG
jgi:hypothetical protein